MGLPPFGQVGCLIKPTMDRAKCPGLIATHYYLRVGTPRPEPAPPSGTETGLDDFGDYAHDQCHQTRYALVPYMVPDGLS